MNADPEKLARVFSNLLRNAASYSYPQTEITISAKRLEHDIQITFENRGETIPEEQLNSIFEKFNRLDDARLSNTGGAGLGLSIAEEIIHLHLSLIHIWYHPHTGAFLRIVCDYL